MSATLSTVLSSGNGRTRNEYVREMVLVLSAVDKTRKMDRDDVGGHDVTRREETEELL